MIALHSDLEFNTATLKIERESDLKKNSPNLTTTRLKPNFVD